MRLMYLKSLDISINLKAIDKVFWNIKPDKESEKTNTVLHLRDGSVVVVSDEDDRALLRYSSRLFDINSGACEEDLDLAIAKLLAGIRGCKSANERIPEADCYLAATTLIEGLLISGNQQLFETIVEQVQRKQDEF